RSPGFYSWLWEIPPVRLVGNNTRCSGQVEIYYDGRWGAVCGLGWDLTDAKVLCRELGCGSPRYVTHHCSKLSRSSAPVLLGQLECTGREASLTQCQAQAWEGRHCPHHRDTGVMCQGEKAVLAPGPHPLPEAQVRSGRAGCALPPECQAGPFEAGTSPASLPMEHRVLWPQLSLATAAPPGWAHRAQTAQHWRPCDVGVSARQAPFTSQARPSQHALGHRPR
uniref:SRCR domain-containing protein n=1 Tax=Gopherus agassizii TaxID=38772 RepID=A0A452HB75_9SAUR